MAYEFPDTVHTFGEAVRHLRMERGMSLRELARRLEVSAPFLCDVEHGRRMPKRVDELAAVLGVEEGDLRRFDGRLHPEVVQWLQENPELAELLRVLKVRGWTAQRIRERLLGT